ncbi:MAG TPA: ATP-binding protein [Burkholderiales bacterium]|nr:ATP-binding protein [Burkholderiales bacterium]
MIYELPTARGTLKPLQILALSVVVGLVIAIEVVIFNGYRQLHASTEEVAKSQETILATQNVLEGILNIETAARGFVISGEEAFLDPYASGREGFAVAIGQALELTGRFPDQQDRLKRIRDLQVEWLDKYVAPLIETRRLQTGKRGNLKSADAIVSSGAGKSYVDRMRALLSEVEDAELDRSMRSRAGLAAYFERSTVRIMVGGVVVLFLVIALSVMLARNLRSMAQVNSRLEIEVAERRAAQSAAQSATDRLNLALDAAGLALWDYDVASGKVFLGAHWKEMLGGSAGETTTSIADLQLLMHPDDVAPVHRLVRDVVRGTGDSYRTQHRVRTLGGEWKWIESHGKVVARDARDIATRMTGINADISERKQAERLKDEFVATVSHELRTPLTAIIGAIGMIKDGVTGNVPDPAKPLLDLAYQNSERLRDLINNILDIEKMESGALRYAPEVVDVVDVLRRAAELNQPYAATLSVRILADLPEKSMHVHVDPARLMQVLTNLLSNAAKFSPGGENVMLSCRDDGNSVRIEVRDRGPGIPQEFRSRIFGKFAQADSSDTRQKGGAGLGLSITRALVEKMNGRVDYESNPGEGATFFVDLPLYDPVSPPPLGDTLRTA